MTNDSLKLKYGFTFEDLFEPLKLKELAEEFYKYYQSVNPTQYEEFEKYRDVKTEGYDLIVQSKILIDSARHIQNFLSNFFNIEQELNELKKHADYEQVVLFIKKDFIQRKVFKNLHESDLPNLKYLELNNKVVILKDTAFSNLDWDDDEEHSTAKMIDEFLKLESHYKSFIDNRPADFLLPDNSANRVEEIILRLKDSGKWSIFSDIVIQDTKNPKAAKQDKYNFAFVNSVVDLLQKWCYVRYYDARAKEEIKNWALYKFPRDLDYNDLVYNKIEDEKIPERFCGDEHHFKKRDGFKLTDKPATFREIMSEVEYCVFCHERKKDSCSKGYKDKDGSIKENPLGIKLEGCPLEEKISEMHTLKYEGLSLAALSMIMIDNPMCPGTGHRICNDCMKACIYQKQEPVNIPKIESNVLKDILNLPWGFEIYSLLTRWNPLNVKRPYQMSYNGKDILVVGMGPAGYTLVQHLLQEGFGVVGIDALKIEPLHRNITGYFENGKYFKPQPLKFFKDVHNELDERILAGFGGVSEYGITVRWDKNFLTVIYLTLSRRKFFKLYDGVRFGGTLEIDDIWNYGFEHIAFASGAGNPTIVDMKNNLIRGIRKSSDFLMSLQLSGSSKKDSIANTMIQLPVVVIGGGLTAVDTATESSAYYPVQVEKFLARYEKLTDESGENFWKEYDEEETQIARTFIEHGRAIRAEREKTKSENRKPNFISLVRDWGGVTISYRKAIQESPAYKLNHEEIIESLEEGINYWEKISPVEAIQNKYGSVDGVKFSKQSLDENGKWTELGEYVTLPAKTVLVAAGTSPNVFYEKEHPDNFVMDERGQYFQTYNVSKENGKIKLTKAQKEEAAFFTSYCKNGKLISIYGDNHPVFLGNVVKAMASARGGAEQITSLFNERDFNPDNEKFFNLLNTLDKNLIARIESVKYFNSNTIEVIVKAPIHARKFKAGQFFKLQNYETNSLKVNKTTLMMEGLALAPAWVDAIKGLIGLVVQESGASSMICRLLKEGERVVLMGPTGTPAEIPENENVILIGEGINNALLMTIGKTMKENGNKIAYFAGFRNSSEVFLKNKIEEAADKIKYVYENKVIDEFTSYVKDKKNDSKSINRIIVIGREETMGAIKHLLENELKSFFNSDLITVAGINSIMQCMMKEVCAQCLQKHIDPITKKEYFVFSCSKQLQNLDYVDLTNLKQRLKSNSVLEKQTKLWVNQILKDNDMTKPVTKETAN